MQLICPISKQDVYVNLDCNLQAIDLKRRSYGNAYGRSQDWQRGNAIIDDGTKETMPCSIFTLELTLIQRNMHRF